jgi:hypothetical protein
VRGWSRRDPPGLCPPFAPAPPTSVRLYHVIGVAGWQAGPPGQHKTQRSKQLLHRPVCHFAVRKVVDWQERKIQGEHHRSRKLFHNPLDVTPVVLLCFRYATVQAAARVWLRRAAGSRAVNVPGVLRNSLELLPDREPGRGNQVLAGAAGAR